MKKNINDLGMAIAFGAYKVTLARNGQVSYFKDGSLSKVVDKPIDFNSADLYQHTLELASKMGFKESDLKRA
jgi:hypothetical protein